MVPLPSLLRMSVKDCTRPTSISELNAATEAKVASMHEFRFYDEDKKETPTSRRPVAILMQYYTLPLSEDKQASWDGWVELHIGDCVNEVTLTPKTKDSALSVTLKYGEEMSITAKFTSSHVEDMASASQAAGKLIEMARKKITDATKKVPGAFYIEKGEGQGTAATWKREPIVHENVSLEEDMNSLFQLNSFVWM